MNSNKCHLHEVTVTYLLNLPDNFRTFFVMGFSKKSLVWILLITLMVIAWIAGLFIDLTGDSGLYAAISRQMTESGNWLNLSINGKPYDQKPHLLFWLSGVGISLFGNYNFAFKLLPFMAGLSGIYSAWRLASLLYSENAGRLAALFTGTSMIFFLYLNDIHTDTVLQAMVTLALWQLTAFLKNGKTANFIFSFVAIGLAMLTKGPIGAFVPFLYVLFYLLINRYFRMLFNMKWLIGIVISLLIISPALIHLYQNFGSEGIKFYFIHNNIGRITGKVAGSSTDYFYYLHNLLWAFLPWTVPVLAGLYLEIKTWKKEGLQNSFSAPLLISTMFTLVILSMARGKAPNYMLMMIPSLVAIASGRIIQARELWKTLIKIQIPVLIILLLIFVLLLYIDNLSNLWFPGLLLATGIFIIVFLRKSLINSEMRAIAYSVLAIATINVFLNIQLLPHLFSYQGARQALAIYEKSRTDKGLMINLHLEEYELYFWAKTPVENISTWENFYEFVKKEDSWVYTDSLGLDVVKQIVPSIETIYPIPQAGMNRIKPRFLMPNTRKQALKNNYLLKIR